jgi:O-antigen ligase
MTLGMTAAIHRLPDKASDRGWSYGPLTAERVCTGIIFMTLIFAWLWNAPEIVDGTVYAGGQSGAVAGDALKQVAFLSLFALAVGSRWKSSGPRSLLVIPATMIPLLGWCWLSTLWAIDPSVAMRRIAFTTLVIVTLACCVQILPYQRVISALTAGCAVVLICDFLAVGVLPYAVHQSDEVDKVLVGAWRGLHGHKNEAGAIVAIATILFLHEAVRQRSWITGVALALLGAVFLYFTKSKTSQAFVVVALLSGYLVHISNRYTRVRLIGLLLLGGAVIPACLVSWDHISSALYDFFLDPASLTGRVQIWPVVLDYVADNPLLGSGYGSFWGLGNQSPILLYSSSWVAVIYEAHNGYLDILAQTGAIGLALAVIGLVLIPLYQLLFRRLEGGVSRSFLCSILIFGWLRDSMESSLMDRASSIWPIMVIALCLLAKYNRSGRAASAIAGGIPDRPVDRRMHRAADPAPGRGRETAAA